MKIGQSLFIFLKQIFRQTIIYVFLALDGLGFVITYYSSIKIPVWILVLIPIIALVLACFNIYQKGTADIRIVFIDVKEPQFSCINLKGNRSYDFKVALWGHIFNFGPQTGAIEDVSYVVGFNKIFDEDILSRMLFKFNLSSFFEGKIERLREECEGKEISLPFVIKPGDIQPFSIFLNFSIPVSPIEDSIFEILQWLNTIDIKVNYATRQSDGIIIKNTEIKVSTLHLFESVLETEGGMQIFNS